MSCSVEFVLHINNDIDIVFGSVQYANPTDVNDPWYNDIADMVFSVEDSDGNDVAGATDLEMAYRAASDGFYIGVLPNTVSALLEDGEEYTVHIVSDAAGIDIRVKLPAGYRQS
jgi:hypothetical protein